MTESVPEIDQRANMPGPRTWCVYAVLNARDAPIYVGSTQCLPARLRTHRRRAPWWGEAASVAWHPIAGPDRDRRFWHESDAIGGLDPKHNVYLSQGGPDAAAGCAELRSATLARYRGQFRTTPAERRDAARLRWIDGLADGRRGHRWFPL